MARPIKDGLSYFPFDVNFFSDKKIKRLRAKFGTDGICVYLYLLCLIYGDKGYYVEYDEDLILDISDELNISEDCTRQIMKYLFSRSLLCEIRDSTLAIPVTIISAKSIQRRFQEAKKGCKRNVFVKAGYWLLKKAETLSLIKVRPDESFPADNDSFSGKNADNSGNYTTKKRKENKSKEKENKVKDMSSTACARGMLTDDQYNALVGMSSVSVVDKYIRKADEWLDKGGRYNNLYLTIKEWLKEDNVKINNTRSGDTSYDLSQWREIAENLDVSTLGFEEEE